MVAFVRRGGSLRQAARRFDCALSTAWFWVKRARRLRLDRIDWSDRPAGRAVPTNRTSRSIERRIVRQRRWLARHDPLGYVGAETVRRTLLAAGEAVPCARTIARILQRAGLTPQKRKRHPSPPPGWYLPPVARGLAELDQLDVIEGLHLRGLGPVATLTGISLWGKLALAEPTHPGWRIEAILPVLTAHWQKWGRPSYLQLDNDPRFAGSHQATRRLGRLVRFCLAQGVIPIFAPPRETGFQAAIESFNHLWQAKVWQRFRHRHLPQLRDRNSGFLCAHRSLVRSEAPTRSSLPPTAATQIIFLRRTDGRGVIRLLGASVQGAPQWPFRLVRAELDVLTQKLHVFALRRREPTHQPLLKTLPFALR